MKRFALILIIFTLAGCGGHNKGPIPPTPTEATKAAPPNSSLVCDRPDGCPVVDTLAPTAKKRRPRVSKVTAGFVPISSGNETVPTYSFEANFIGSSNLFINPQHTPTVEIIYQDGEGIGGLIRIKDKDGKLLAEVLNDGTVKMGDGNTPDEAAQAFWKALATAFPLVCTNVHQN